MSAFGGFFFTPLERYYFVGLIVTAIKSLFAARNKGIHVTCELGESIKKANHRLGLGYLDQFRFWMMEFTSETGKNTRRRRRSKEKQRGYEF